MTGDTLIKIRYVAKKIHNYIETCIIDISILIRCAKSIALIDCHVPFTNMCGKDATNIILL